MASSSTLWGVQRRTALRTGAVLALLSLLFIWIEVGTAGLFLGFVLAVLPVPIYVSLALWLDRFEDEPMRLLLKAFVWGAVVAIFFALLGNGVFGVVTGSDLAVTVISVPIVEEVAKGLALLLLFHQQRDEFDNITDGVVYAFMVGLGFAMTENILYYGAAHAEGVVGAVFFGRGVLSPFAHPLFTAMTGIGLGLARETQRTSVRVLAPLAGLLLAILLHALWNLSAVLGLFLAIYPLLMVPTFVTVLLVVQHSLGKEEAIIRKYLGPYVPVGVLSGADLDAICSVRRRWRLSWRMLLRRDPGAWRERRRLHQAASELAFHHWRVARGISAGAETDARREEEYLERLRRLVVGSAQLPVRGVSSYPKRT